jgi:hypothetical protein
MKSPRGFSSIGKVVPSMPMMDKVKEIPFCSSVFLLKRPSRALFISVLCLPLSLAVVSYAICVLRVS